MSRRMHDHSVQSREHYNTAFTTAVCQQQVLPSTSSVYTITVFNLLCLRLLLSLLAVTSVELSV
jgi:hypothetical protein